MLVGMDVGAVQHINRKLYNQRVVGLSLYHAADGKRPPVRLVTSAQTWS